MLHYLKRTKTSIDDGCTSVIDDLRHQREVINKRFDVLEKRIIEEVKKFQAEDSFKISNDITELDDLQYEIKNLKAQIDSDCHKNESQTLIDLIECQNYMAKCDKRMRELSVTALPVGYQLIVLKTFDEFLDNVKDPSAFKVEKTIASHPSRGIIPNSLSTQTKYFYSNKVQTRNVMDEHDITICNLYSSCKLPGGNVLLTDKNNCTLIRLNNALKLKDKCSLDESPSAVACVSENEAVITASRNKIMFVAINKQLMSVNRTLTLNHTCNAVAYNRGMLYVSDGPSTINVYSKSSGNILSSIVANYIGLQMFAEIRHIAISPDGTRIYVADSKKGLVILDSDGRHITTVQDDLLDEAFGVCVGNSGNVYVSGLKSLNVVQIEPDNLTISEVVKMDGKQYPQSICIDETKRQLIVTLCSSNTFKLFLLKQ